MLNIKNSHLVLFKNWDSEAVELIATVPALRSLVAPLLHSDTSTVYTVELVGGARGERESLIIWACWVIVAQPVLFTKGLILSLNNQKTFSKAAYLKMF